MPANLTVPEARFKRCGRTDIYNHLFVESVKMLIRIYLRPNASNDIIDSIHDARLYLEQWQIYWCVVLTTR